MSHIAADNPARPPASRAFWSQTALTTAITAIAGYLDAVGYVQLNHLYVSFMSGNSTHLGMSVAGGDWIGAAMICAIVGAFCLGAFAGSLLAESDRATLPTLFVTELVLLLIACALAVGGAATAALVVVAGAMGLQNSGHRVIAGADVGRTFITGVLFGIGRSLALFVRGRAPAAEVLIYLGSWLAFVVGVVIGSFAITGLGLVVALGAMAAAVGLLAATTYTLRS